MTRRSDGATCTDRLPVMTVQFQAVPSPCICIQLGFIPLFLYLLFHKHFAMADTKKKQLVFNM